MNNIEQLTTLSKLIAYLSSIKFLLKEQNKELNHYLETFEIILILYFEIWKFDYSLIDFELNDIVDFSYWCIFYDKEDLVLLGENLQFTAEDFFYNIIKENDK